MEAAREEDGALAVMAVTEECSTPFQLFSKSYEYYTKENTKTDGSLFDRFRVCEAYEPEDTRLSLPRGLDPRCFLKMEPELIAGKATDLSNVYQQGQVKITFCGHSANTTFFFAKRAAKYRDRLDAVCSRKNGAPTVSFSIVVKCLKLVETSEELDEDATGSFEQTLFSSDCNDNSAMERMISVGEEIFRLRKAIYAADTSYGERGADLGDLHDSGVTFQPFLSVQDIEQLIEAQVMDDEAREFLLEHLNGDDERISGAIRLGYIYSFARAKVRAWWLPFVECFGFGGSRTPCNFDKDRMYDFLDSLRPERRRELLCRSVLCWACCDGSIDEKKFELEVATHTKDSLGDSIVDFMKEICGEIFGSDVHFSTKDVPKKNKCITCMKVKKRKSLRKIRQALEPYLEDYVPRWKRNNLLSY